MLHPWLILLDIYPPDVLANPEMTLDLFLALYGPTPPSHSPKEPS